MTPISRVLTGFAGTLPNDLGEPAFGPELEGVGGHSGGALERGPGMGMFRKPPQKKAGVPSLRGSAGSAGSEQVRSPLSLRTELSRAEFREPEEPFRLAAAGLYREEVGPPASGMFAPPHTVEPWMFQRPEIRLEGAKLEPHERRHEVSAERWNLGLDAIQREPLRDPLLPRLQGASLTALVLCVGGIVGGLLGGAISTWSIALGAILGLTVSGIALWALWAQSEKREHR